MAGHVCPWWMAYTFDNLLRGLVHPPKSILAPYLEEGMTVLDVGCGMGFFSIAMAEIIGPKGCVIAVDLQPQMLKVLRTRAEKKGVADRIITRACEQNDLKVTEKVNFALAFYMLHEIPNEKKLFSQLSSCLDTQGRLLMVEPVIHVSRADFKRAVNTAVDSGFKLAGAPPVRLSYSALFEPAG
jgi:ubiquinone/menaquinone biosynthesis C-methylase UbiE